MSTFPLKIVTPDGLIYDGEAEKLIVRTSGGDVCILARHMDYVAPLGMGMAIVEANGKRRTRWYDVQVRVHPDFRLEMHVDTDDANAVGIGNGSLVKLIKK